MCMCDRGIWSRVPGRALSEKGGESGDRDLYASRLHGRGVRNGREW